MIYQQTAGELHALSGLISLAASLSADDLFEIVEGNNEIPAKLLESSKVLCKTSSCLILGHPSSEHRGKGDRYHGITLHLSTKEYVAPSGDYVIRTEKDEHRFPLVIISTPLGIFYFFPPAN